MRCPGRVSDRRWPLEDAVCWKGGRGGGRGRDCVSEEPTQSAHVNVVARYHNAVAAHSKNKDQRKGLLVVARWLEAG